MATRTASVTGRPTENSMARARRASRNSWLAPAESARANIATPSSASTPRQSDGELGQGQIQHGDVIGGGTRTGVAGRNTMDNASPVSSSQHPNG